MKGVAIYIYIIVVALLMASCHDEVTTVMQNGNSAIYLSAVTEGHEVTRAPYDYTVPTDSPEGLLNTAIWASSFVEKNNGNIVGYTFPDLNLNGKNGEGQNVNQVAIHATAEFDSGHPQLLDQAVYPKMGTPVFFVGLHPQNGWVTNSGNSVAEFTFNGSQDVMFAPRIEGKYASTSDQNNLAFDAPVLKFWHLLTWLRICVVAENDDAISAWGKIKSMKITSKNKVRVDISAPENNGDNLFNPGYAEFSDDVLLPLYATGTDNTFPSAEGYALKSLTSGATGHDEVAYVLCSPVVGRDFETIDGVDVEVAEYMLHIETDNRRIELPIDLRKNADSYFMESTRAKCFTLNLTFKVGSTILVAAEIEEWQLGGNGEVIL